MKYIKFHGIISRPTIVIFGEDTRKDDAELISIEPKKIEKEDKEDEV